MKKMINYINKHSTNTLSFSQIKQKANEIIEDNLISKNSIYKPKTLYYFVSFIICLFIMLGFGVFVIRDKFYLNNINYSINSLSYISSYDEKMIQIMNIENSVEHKLVFNKKQVYLSKLLYYKETSMKQLLKRLDNVSQYCSTNSYLTIDDIFKKREMKQVFALREKYQTSFCYDSKNYELFEKYLSYLDLPYIQFINTSSETINYLNNYLFVDSKDNIIMKNYSSSEDSGKRMIEITIYEEGYVLIKITKRGNVDNAKIYMSLMPLDYNAIKESSGEFAGKVGFYFKDVIKVEDILEIKKASYYTVDKKIYRNEKLASLYNSLQNLYFVDNIDKLKETRMYYESNKIYFTVYYIYLKNGDYYELISNGNTIYYLNGELVGYVGIKR